ncbi:serine/threonine-protein kinase [Nannocystis sp.]|uniref:serine/threonine-protein kinase n=1 Tax=Nannocystis sp. TaxID=1962667 RepID=UPI0024283319|nr:serine/threonine-protein kinase [Nannocystis sp.]MBK7824823.1 serine/threonine protein kinase [Nannocystis sp.]MBK9752925.1 serine/threonine protein kinase [Nannocystis sp.]
MHAEDVLVCPKETKVLPLEGRILDGKFRFTKLLGAGGMGAVWRAQNVRVRKAVAIKLMHPEFAGNPGILDRFKNEATAAGQIGSQHICDIYDFGASALGPYIVLEMLNGRSFGELIQQYGRVDPGLAAIVMRQALIGLEAAHQVGIIHRDLKPENIFLHEPSPGHLLVKLMDFGISKFSQGGNDGKTGVGVLMGTPEYMSPEQAEGAASADQRTDIWAMGAILYKALTGIEAFGGPTMAATLVALSTKEPKPIDSIVPGIPPELIAVVRRCLVKDPAGRYQSARELADALTPFEQFAGALPSAPQPTIGGGALSTTSPQGQVGNQQPAGGTHISAPPAPQATMITGHGPPGPTTTPVANPATFVGGNLGAAGGADDSWSIGQHNDTRPPTLTAPPSGGSKLPIIIIVVLLLAAAGGAAYFMTAKGPRDHDIATNDGKSVATVGATAGTPTDTKIDPSATAGTTPPIGTTAGTTAGTTPPPDTTAGATAGTTPPPDTTAGATAGTTAPPDPTAGDTAGATTHTNDTAGDDDGDEKHTKLPPPKPDLAVIAQQGALFTTKAPANVVASVDDAKAHCATLKKSKFGKLGAWKLASSGEILKFKDNKDVQKLAYWVSDPGSAGRVKRVNLINGSISEADAKSFSRTRPFCVAKR